MSMYVCPTGQAFQADYIFYPHNSAELQKIVSQVASSSTKKVVVIELEEKEYDCFVGETYDKNEYHIFGRGAGTIIKQYRRMYGTENRDCKPSGTLNFYTLVFDFKYLTMPNSSVLFGTNSLDGFTFHNVVFKNCVAVRWGIFADDDNPNSNRIALLENCIADGKYNYFLCIYNNNRGNCYLKNCYGYFTNYYGFGFWTVENSIINKMPEYDEIYRITDDEATPEMGVYAGTYSWNLLPVSGKVSELKVSSQIILNYENLTITIKNFPQYEKVFFNDKEVEGTIVNSTWTGVVNNELITKGKNLLRYRHYRIYIYDNKNYFHDMYIDENNYTTTNYSLIFPTENQKSISDISIKAGTKEIYQTSNVSFNCDPKKINVININEALGYICNIKYKEGGK